MADDILDDTCIHTQGIQKAFLKLYDWRQAVQLRKDKNLSQWTQDTETKYIQLVLDGGINDSLRLPRPSDFFKGIDVFEGGADIGKCEALLAHDYNRI